MRFRIEILKLLTTQRYSTICSHCGQYFVRKFISLKIVENGDGSVHLAFLNVTECVCKYL